MAKSTCSTSSNSSYSSAQSASTSCSSKSSQHSTGSSHHHHHLGFKSVTDRRKRLAANARERKRMHLLNQAYDRLRKRLVDAENKSKYDVLVQAKEYIQALAAICEKMDTKETIPSSPGESTSYNHPTPMRPESTNVTSTSPPATTTPATTNHTTYVTPVDTSPLIVPQFDVHSQHQHQHQYHHHHAITRYDRTLDYV